MRDRFDLQGHRGARGLKPENTLPAFEAALDLMASSLETDLHLSRDGVPVLFHDKGLSEKLARLLANGGRKSAESVPSPETKPCIRSLTVEQLRRYIVDRNPDPVRFPQQDATPTPVAQAFARGRGIHPLTLPTLADLFAFVEAYAGELGKQAGKTDGQRSHAKKVRFNLEIKRVPFRPENIGDAFDGDAPAELEKKFLDEVRRAGVVERTMIQCFDHRVIRAMRKLEPKLQGAALISGTAPASIPQLVKDADAQVYSPDFEFLDKRQIDQAHAAPIRVVPYTVNDTDDMKRLMDWGIDGIITDFPDRLIGLLRERKLKWMD